MEFVLWETNLSRKCSLAAVCTQTRLKARAPDKTKEMVSADRGAEGNKGEPMESRWEGTESLAKHWRRNYIGRNLLASVKVIT